MMYSVFTLFFFFFNDTPTTVIYTLSLHDALPIFAGDTDEANTLLDRALRLDPYSATALFYRGIAYFVGEKYDRAIITLKSSLALNPDFGGAHQFLAAVHGLLGRDHEARAEAAEVLRQSPDFARGILRTPFGDRADLLRLIDGLRKAGLDIPDQAAAAE